MLGAKSEKQFIWIPNFSQISRANEAIFIAFLLSEQIISLIHRKKKTDDEDNFTIFLTQKRGKTAQLATTIYLGNCTEMGSAW